MTFCVRYSYTSVCARCGLALSTRKDDLAMAGVVNPSKDLHASVEDSPCDELGAKSREVNRENI
jgi:hypothetical protein